MPRFFFDIHDGIVVEDETGVELPDMDAAHGHALHLSQEYARSPGMIGQDGGVLVVTIRDASKAVRARHRLIFTIEDVDLVG